jgi:hypothetical protein
VWGDPLSWGKYRQPWMDSTNLRYVSMNPKSALYYSGTLVVREPPQETHVGSVLSSDSRQNSLAPADICPYTKEKGGT